MSLCPHCHESVDASELIEESADDWSCYNCGAGNSYVWDICVGCGLSHDTSEHYASREDD